MRRSDREKKLEQQKIQKEKELSAGAGRERALDVRDLRVRYHGGEQQRSSLTASNPGGSFRRDHGAVKGISFYVDPGEIVGIAGESGSGKSTAMLAVMGLLDSRAEVSAEKITSGGKNPVPGENIAMIFQDSLSCLNPTLTVGRQIAETVRHRRKCSRKESLARAEELLDLVGIRSPKVRMKQYPFELSGGMRQRVVIAAALACEPELIIADEPTTALDAAVRAQILLLLKRLVRETKTSLLLVSHDLGAVAALCERVYIMNRGRIVETGTTEEIFSCPAEEYTRQLVSDARDRSLLVEEKARENGDGKLLKAEGLTKLFDAGEGIADISMEIKKGEIFALVGESGSGKTTLARILTGILEADSGKLFFQGELLGIRRRERKRTKEQLRKIQMVFQDPYASLNPRLTAGEAIEEALRAGGIRDSRKRRKMAEEMLCRTGLSAGDADKYPAEFSGGQRQRIGIARALVPDPELLVCDEALSSLDASIQAQILELLLDLWRRQKIACLFISHDMHTVRRVSTKIGVMFRGWMVEKGNTREVCSDPWHPYTKQLLDAVPEADPVKARRIKAPVFAENTGTGGGCQGKGERRGCPFAPRCGYAMECCREEMPEAYRFGDREVRCFLYSARHSGKRETGYRMTSQI